MLLDRPGELVTRDELRNRLWPSDTFVDFNHGLNAAVNKLREALSDSADSPRYIETLPRRGYRFIAAVEWIAPVCAAVAASPELQPAPAATASRPPEVQISRPDMGAEEVAPTAAEPSTSKFVSRFLLGVGAIFTVLLIAGLTIQLASKSAGKFTSLLNGKEDERQIEIDGHDVAVLVAQ